MTTAAIDAAGLTLEYGGLAAVDNASFTVPTGSTVSVIGPNGSGKSTLLRAIAGLHEPASGQLRVPAQSRRGGVSLVLQSTEVDRSLPITVTEAVRLGRYPSLGPFRRFAAADHSAVERSMTALNVEDLSGLQLHELSGGQRQRVLVAQGLAQEGDVLLLDEPSTGLDLVSQELVFEVIAKQRDLGKTVLISSHSLDDARRCDLVLLLSRRVIAFGPPQEVLTDGPLTEAFGGRALRLADGSMIVDDPHHVHG